MWCMYVCVVYVCIVLCTQEQDLQLPHFHGCVYFVCGVFYWVLYIPKNKTSTTAAFRCVGSVWVLKYVQRVKHSCAYCSMPLYNISSYIQCNTLHTTNPPHHQQQQTRTTCTAKVAATWASCAATSWAPSSRYVAVYEVYYRWCVGCMQCFWYE